MSYQLTCPSCGGHDTLFIEAKVDLRVAQAENGEFETYLDDADYTYGPASMVTCDGCGFRAAMNMFHTNRPRTTNPGMEL